MSPDRRWKRHERETATLLGSVRLPSNGRAQPDIIAGPFAVEHKSRETLPQWLASAIAQAQRNAGDGQTPLLILTTPNGRGRKPTRLVVLDFGDFIDWYGPVNGADDDASERHPHG